MSIDITFPGGRTKALTFSYDDGRDLTANWSVFSTITD